MITISNRQTHIAMEPKHIHGSTAIEYNVQAFARPWLSKKNKIRMGLLEHRTVIEIDFINMYLGGMGQHYQFKLCCFLITVLCSHYYCLDCR